MRNLERPLSPHLQIWRWGPHMLVSILHRVTGTGLATVGSLLLIWGLAAAATGEESYATFLDLLTVESGAINIVGAVLGIGLSWAFFTHLFNGLRHFVMDVGAGYELRTNKRWSVIVVAGAILATVALWAWLLRGFVAGLFGGGA